MTAATLSHFSAAVISEDAMAETDSIVCIEQVTRIFFPFLMKMRHCRLVASTIHDFTPRNAESYSSVPAVGGSRCKRHHSDRRMPRCWGDDRSSLGEVRMAAPSVLLHVFMNSKVTGISK